jgi:hypothetical protein
LQDDHMLCSTFTNIAVTSFGSIAPVAWQRVRLQVSKQTRRHPTGSTMGVSALSSLRRT